MTETRPGTLAWALLLILGLIWGASFMLTNIAIRGGIPPLTLAALRLALAAVLLVLAARTVGARLPSLRGDRRLWAFALASALIGNVLPFTLIGWSQNHIPSAMTALLMAPMPLVSLLLSHWLIQGEALSPLRFAGFFAAFGGVALLIGGDVVAGGFDFTGMAFLGQLASLLAMLCYAVNGIIMKRANAPDPYGISAAIIGLAALVALPAALVLERPDFTAPTLGAWWAAALLGLTATALAQVTLMRILALAGPPFLASVNYQIPLWATVFGLIFLGEALPGDFWLALGLILGGLGLAQLAARRRG